MKWSHVTVTQRTINTVDWFLSSRRLFYRRWNSKLPEQHNT